MTRRKFISACAIAAVAAAFPQLTKPAATWGRTVGKSVSLPSPCIVRSDEHGNLLIMHGHFHDQAEVDALLRLRHGDGKVTITNCTFANTRLTVFVGHYDVTGCFFVNGGGITILQERFLHMTI